MTVPIYNPNSGPAHGNQPPPNRNWVTTEETKARVPGLRKYVLPVMISAGVGLAFGVILSIPSASSGPEAAPAVPAPTVTVVETLESEVVTQKTPQSCIDALDAAMDIVDVSKEMAYLVGDHFGADSTLFSELAVGDYSGMEAYQAHVEDFSSEVGDLTVRVNSNKLGELDAACRGEA